MKHKRKNRSHLLDIIPLRKFFHSSTRSLKEYIFSGKNDSIHQCADRKTMVSVSHSTGAKDMYFRYFNIRGNSSIYRIQRVALMNVYCVLSERSQLFGQVTIFHKSNDFSLNLQPFV